MGRVRTKKELIDGLRDLGRYDPEIDPYSSGCNPLAIMDKARHGDWLRRSDVINLVEESEGDE